MNKKKIKEIMKYLIIVFCVFMTGFLGTMILIMKRTSDMTSTIVAAQSETTEFVRIFGVKVMEFKSVYKDGAYVIDIIKNNLYDYFPFIVGFVVLLLVFVLMFIVRKMTRKTVKG